MSDEADPLQLSMIGINPATAYLLLNRYISLMPGDWVGQTAANAAMGQYIIQLAKLAGVKTLNIVRRKEAAEQVRQRGGDRVVLQGDNVHKDIEDAVALHYNPGLGRLILNIFPRFNCSVIVV
jgi:NADPH:quinone reductase-like Zn-dependent oxidoreductase